MTIEFDDNGKFFTEIVSKIPVAVMIQTAIHRIHGDIHIAQDLRLKDVLDLPEKFIAITDAVVYTPDGRVLNKTKFLAVQRDHIIWVIPDAEVVDPTSGSVK